MCGKKLLRKFGRRRQDNIQIDPLKNGMCKCRVFYLVLEKNQKRTLPNTAIKLQVSQKAGWSNLTERLAAFLQNSVHKNDFLRWAI